MIGNVLGKIRPNWFAGIRTPWTLDSNRSWTKTHRLGGWLFVLLGLGLILAGISGSAWAILAALACLICVTVLLLVYSYLVWRNDPARSGG